MSRLFWKPYLLFATTRADEIFSLLLNFWLFVVIVVYYDAITDSIITSIFYNIPKPALLVIVQGCLMWSCICFAARRLSMKLSAVIVNTGLYIWVASTSLSTNPISVVAGTYLILALRHILIYFALKAKEGSDVGNV